MELASLVTPEVLEKVKGGWYALMFILMVVEWPLITLAAAVLASMGFFNIFIVAILGWLGDMIGDFLFFSIGRFWLKNFSKKTKIDTDSEKSFVSKLDTIIDKNLLLAIFIVKFIPYAPPIGFPYIGRSKIPFMKFFRNSMISCLPIPIIITILGFNIGHITAFWNNSSLQEKIFTISAIIWLIGVLFFIIWFIKKKIAENIGDSSDFVSAKKNEKTDRIDAKSQKLKK